MLGVVNLDKPVGPTSHDMVSLLRRLTGTRRVGHAGTLDPLASGVLPILVGHATRFSDELSGGTKRYEAVFRIGATSLTDDAEGPITPSGVGLPAAADVERELAGFVGSFQQRPPAFSARKLGGRAAYRAARAGEPLELAPREVTVHSIEVRGVARADAFLDVTADVHREAGTYLRSIARDLAERLGSGCYLLALRRTEAAGLRAEAACTPDDLLDLAARGDMTRAVQPNAPLLRLPTVELDELAARRFTNGAPVTFASAQPAGRVAVHSGGRLLGIGTVEGDALRPAKVLPPANVA